MEQFLLKNFAPQSLLAKGINKDKSVSNRW